MEVLYHKRFLKHYEARIVPNRKLVQALKKRLDLFLRDPHHPLLKDHKLIGQLNEHRAFSITGDIRVVYLVQDNTILLYDIGTHNQVY